MKFIIFFICTHLVYSEWHSFMSAYTGISGQTAAGIPEFSAVTTLDGHQIDYYDNNTMKLIPKQDWMKEFASKGQWKEYIEMREKHRQIFKNNIHILMEKLSQSNGVHTYQRMYGCDWDDETGDSYEFDQYGYDGEDFISLDVKKFRYIADVVQAIPTVEKWNNDREQLKSRKRYNDYECVYWLKELLHLSKATFKKTERPEASLLQKSPDSYVYCHITGFLFRDTTISWRKNGQVMSNSSKLEYGDLLPNEDGTFQRTLTLYVHPDKWKDGYTCVVEHKTFTEPIQMILTVNEIKSNKPASDVSYNMYTGFLVIISIVLLCIIWKYKKFKACCKRRCSHEKSKLNSPEHAKDRISCEEKHVSEESLLAS